MIMAAFTTSGKRREDLSTKLRVENMTKTKEETRNLETESRKMEERLQELKMAMSKEKEERERSNFTGYWKTGALGKLSDYGTKALGQHAVKQHKETKKKTIKVLKAESDPKPSKKAPAATPGTMAFIAQRGNSGGGSSSSKIKGPKCGQCENKGAHVSCVECGEDYCAQCFASFHMKGALKKHRSVPIGSSITPRTPRHSTDVIFNQPDPPSKETNPMKVTLSEIDFEMEKMGEEEELEMSDRLDNGGGDGNAGTLLDGQYNEADAAAEFQQALRAWRGENTNNGQAPPPRPVSRVKTPIVSADNSTGTDMKVERQKVDIHFTSGLSYAERLLLKKHRRADVASVSSGAGTYTPHSDMTLIDADEDGNGDGDGNLLRGSLERERVDFGAISSAVASLHKGSEEEEDDELRTESRVSIVEWSNQPKKKSRGLEQSSAYQVTEMTDFVDYSSIPNEWKHPDDRKMAFSTPVSDPIKHPPTPTLVHTPTPPTTPTPTRAFSGKGRRLKKPAMEESTNREHASTARKERELVREKTVGSKQSGEKTVGSKQSGEKTVQPKQSGKKTPLPATTSAEQRNLSPRKTWTKDFTILDDFQTTLTELRKKEEASEEAEKQSRSQSRGQRSRPTSARSRPQSSRRPKSRAQTRLELFGEGTLTKGPSASLKQIANMQPDGAAAAPPPTTTGLADFFLAGVQPAPQEPRTLTPTNMKSARGKGNAGWKISNKIYQLGPRSWRPSSSLGDTVPDTDAQAHLADMMPTYREHLMPTDDQAQEEEEQRKVDGLEFSLSGGLRELSSVQGEDRTRSSTTPTASQNARQQDGRHKADDKSDKTPSRHTKTPNSSRPASARKPHSSGKTSSRSESRSGRESSVIVVDGDDMSRYDAVDDTAQCGDEKEEAQEALDQLEWELASETGRIQDDGKISRLEMPLEDDPDSDLDPLTGRDLITPVNCAQDPGFDIDTKLRATDLTDDFEELEEQMHDEEEVHALR